MKPVHCQKDVLVFPITRRAAKRAPAGKNLGPKTWSRLIATGILDMEDLSEIGAVSAYVRLKTCFPGEVSLNALWAMQAALMDCDWRELPVELKDKLRSEVKASVREA